MRLQFISFLLISSILNTTPCFAETIYFVPTIQREDFAEEAIILLQCLTERSGANWEFSQAPGGSSRLEIQETKQGTMKGRYTRAEKEKNFDWQPGNTTEICDQLEPNKAPFDLPQQISSFPEETLPQVGESKSIPNWVWLGVAGTALGAFFLWKKSQPATHSALRMD